MAGKFEIYEDEAGEHRFRLKAGNGETVLVSEGYSAKASAKNGVESVKENGTDPSRFEKSTTATGKYRFRLEAKNNQVIGTSQNYDSEAGRNNGIEAVGRALDGATVVDLTAT